MDSSATVTRRSSRTLAVPLAVMAVAALLGACGDGADTTAADPSSTSTSATSAPSTSATPTSASTGSSTTTAGGEECSAANLAAEPTDLEGLPGPVDEMRRSIVAAATACDFERLAGLARAGSFTHSFGDDGDPAASWRRAEVDGDPLAALVHFLNRPYATRPAGDATQYVWPRAYTYESWAEVPPDARQELRPVYGDEDFSRFERFGSYSGYRVGVTGGGDWVFFVAGD